MAPAHLRQVLCCLLLVFMLSSCSMPPTSAPLPTTQPTATVTSRTPTSEATPTSTPPAEQSTPTHQPKRP